MLPILSVGPTQAAGGGVRTMSRSMCAHALTNQGYILCDRLDRGVEMKAKMFYRPSPKAVCAALPLRVCCS